MKKTHVTVSDDLKIKLLDVKRLVYEKEKRYFRSYEQIISYLVDEWFKKWRKELESYNKG